MPNAYDSTTQPVGTAQWVFVTREMAAAWLENLSDNQRSFVPGHSDRLMTQMEQGYWKLSMQDAVCLNDIGELDNGRHRLETLLRTELEGLWMFVASEADPDAYDVYDTGRTRRVRDNLKGDYLSTLAPAIVRDYLIANNISLASTKSAVSPVVAREHLAKFPTLQDSTNFVCRNRAGLTSAMTTWISTHHHLVRETQDIDAVNAYFTHLAAWEGDNTGTVAVRVHNRVKALSATVRNVHETMNVIICGWNHWVKGVQDISRLEIPHATQAAMRKTQVPFTHPLVPVKKTGPRMTGTWAQ